MEVRMVGNNACVGSARICPVGKSAPRMLATRGHERSDLALSPGVRGD